MALSKNVLIRIEAMMDRGQVHSEPESLSSTDRMLDVLQSRSQSAATYGLPSNAKPKASARLSAGERKRTQQVNWLDLPSLPELLQARTNLLQQHAAWNFLDVGSRQTTDNP